MSQGVYQATDRRAHEGWGASLRFARWDALALASLVAAAVLVFWRLALTDLIVGRGDVFFYFYPYRDFASAAARAGRLPLWNPFLFMGVPFLANSQAGFFYPLNLALAWLPVEWMVSASIVIHAALAGVGTFLWGRRGLVLGRPAAWLAGLCYGLGGYFVAQVEHLNQVQVLAWLPWLLWLYERRGARRGMRMPGMALVIALQFLAGHTQSVFICLVGLASYVLLPLAWNALRRRNWGGLVGSFCLIAGAAALGGALAAVQLLPTLELSRLSMRSGGLPYREAVSFSLRPELVGRALLPSWGAPLFPEFIAHVGVVGLGLAAVGVWVVWRASAVPGGLRGKSRLDVAKTGELPAVERRAFARRGAVVLVALGLFLALGGFNPVYFLLVKLVPGFGLFRAPARWLALYALGVAGLAGLGFDGLVAVAEAQSASRGLQGVGRRWLVTGLALAGLVLLGQLLGGDPDPDLAPPLGLWSVIGWLAAALLLGAVCYSRGSSPRFLGPLLIVLVVLELFGASLFLPFNRATAPGALTSRRPAVAHLLAEAGATVSGPPARFLSISDIFFDPGDKPEIEIVLGPQLSGDALYDYIIATKQKEVLIPNLPLYYRLPAMDGYDGGVLPLRHYVTLERLYMPEENVAIDGRLRENLESVPDGRWLSLFNVRFVVTDKVGDAWFDGVFYDLQMGARLRAGDEATVGHVPALASTALGVVYQAGGATEGTPLAEVELILDGERRVILPLLADGTGDGDRVARLNWEQVATPSAISVRGSWQAGEVVIRGLSLIDERTGTFQSLVLSDSGRYRLVHSGDVKIYENLAVLPRAFFVPEAIAVPDDDAALSVMRDPDFDPSATVVLVHDDAMDSAARISPGSATRIGATGQAETELLVYEPERVLAAVVAPTDGWLLLSDAWYPGWEATVDSQPVPVERADVLFRAVAVPAGQHRVEWVYRPVNLRLGAMLSLGALVLLLLWDAVLGHLHDRRFKLGAGDE